MMRKVTIRSRHLTQGEWREMTVDALTTNTVGLVVHPLVGRDAERLPGWWGITHWLSGALVGTVRDPEAAMRIANVVIPERLPTVDWTMDGPALQDLFRVNGWKIQDIIPEMREHEGTLSPVVETLNSIH